MTPQDEATQIFHEVIRDLTGGNGDILITLRRCQHACQLLGWNQQLEWFQLELGGYPKGKPIPEYRRITGNVHWVRETRNPHQIAIDLVEKQYNAPASWEYEDEIAYMDVWWPVNEVLDTSLIGYQERTGATRNVSGLFIGNVKIEQVRDFHKTAFNALLSRIEHLVFDFASKSYSILRYANLITDIWAQYRFSVDKALRELGFEKHIDAIQSDLTSENPESWRYAIYGCRNLFDELANHLWQDPRPTYDLLPSSDNKGRLDVTSGKSKNRFRAYIHQKGLRDRNRKFLEDEVERLDASIRSLIDMQSIGHAAVTKEDARSAALATYFILGELVTKTDMRPVVDYS